MIDVDKLKEDLKREYHGAYFGGGFGAALISARDIEKASPEKLAEAARQMGLDLRDYETSD